MLYSYVSATYSLSRLRSTSSSESVVSLSAAVSDEQEGEHGYDYEAHHDSPDDDGNHPLVVVGPALHL